jgi:hypothetical protein
VVMESSWAARACAVKGSWPVSAAAAAAVCAPVRWKACGGCCGPGRLVATVLLEA